MVNIRISNIIKKQIEIMDLANELLTKPLGFAGSEPINSVIR